MLEPKKYANGGLVSPDIPTGTDKDGELIILLPKHYVHEPSQDGEYEIRKQAFELFGED